MTRFARAKGSKSSNERLPEPPTSWQEMKQQLLEAQQQTNQPEERPRRIFPLEEKTVTEEWAVFEEEDKRLVKTTKLAKAGKKKKNIGEKHANGLGDSDNRKLHKLKDNNNKIKKRKEVKVELSSNTLANGDIHKSVDIVNISTADKIKKKKRKLLEKKVKTKDDNNSRPESHQITDESMISKKKKKKKLLETRAKAEDDNISQSESHQVTDESMSIKKKKKKKMMKKKKLLEKRAKTNDANISQSESHQITDENMISKKKKKMKKKGKKIQRDGESVNSITMDTLPAEESLVYEDKTANKKIGKNKHEKIGMETSKQLQETTNQDWSSTTPHSNYDKPYKRRKPDEGVTTLYINGKEVEVIKFDGFPVKKEDADRLNGLKKRMYENKIPVNEIKVTMKLERRKAEKALARERKKVCFQCRKAGHVLSECPELGTGNGKPEDTTVTGICFKCGSTEHTHYECRVTRGPEFRFAKCFYCDEQGHIARQCPDNPRGLYPKGGECRICGDVTHLKKDCPQGVKEKEEQTIRLETLNNTSLEVLDEDLKKVKNPSQKTPKAKKKKTVKF